MSVAIRAPCTVGDIRVAESFFRPEIQHFIATVDGGEEVPDTHPIRHECDVGFRPHDSLAPLRYFEHPRVEVGDASGASVASEEHTGGSEEMQAEEDDNRMHAEAGPSGVTGSAEGEIRERRGFLAY